MRFFAALFVTTALFAQAPRPGWMGFGYTRHETGTEQWLTVQFIVPNGPAQKADLRERDLIMAINGKPIRFADDVAMLEAMSALRAGAGVKLSLIRGDERIVRTIKPAVMTDEQYARWKQNLELARKEKARAQR